MNERMFPFLEKLLDGAAETVGGGGRIKAR